MVMVVGESRDDAGAQLMRLGIGHFERRHLLQMVVQEPRMVDQAEQNQRLAAGNHGALAKHDRGCGELRACRLVGAGGELRGAGYPLFSRTGGARPPAPTPGAGLKPPGGWPATPAPAG